MSYPEHQKSSSWFLQGIVCWKENIVVWVSNKKKADNPDEDYFVAKIEEKKMKLEEDETCSAVLYRKNQLDRFCALV